MKITLIKEMELPKVGVGVDQACEAWNFTPTTLRELVDHKKMVHDENWMEGRQQR
jgi:hypothetical protein